MHAPMHLHIYIYICRCMCVDIFTTLSFLPDRASSCLKGSFQHTYRPQHVHVHGEICHGCMCLCGLCRCLAILFLSVAGFSGSGAPLFAAMVAASRPQSKQLKTVKSSSISWRPTEYEFITQRNGRFRVVGSGFLFCPACARCHVFVIVPLLRLGFRQM